jgi:predicted esterase
VFLHGIGERGTDNLSQIQVNPQAMAYVSYSNQVFFPAFFAAPQCPGNRTWNDSIMVPQLGEWLDSLIAEFPIDTNRISVTGLSMGGYGSWALLEARPTFFASALPVCGGGNSSRCTLFRQVPIWNFHAADDGSVPVSESRNMITALRQAGGTPVYTEYRSGGHGIWANAYATPGLVEWTMAQRPDQPSPVEPRLMITNPTRESTWTTGAAALDLGGSASWGTETITQVSWTNLALRAGGVAQGTGSWNCDGVRLQANSTNRLVVIASGPSLAPERSGATTFSDTLMVYPVPPIVLQLRPLPAQLVLTWAGGLPPFRIQCAPRLVDANWTDVQELSGNTVTLPVPPQAESMFYRVMGH